MTPRKEKALRALLVSRTRAEAAKTAGIGESTLREYMKDTEFMERYKQAFGDSHWERASALRRGEHCK